MDAESPSDHSRTNRAPTEEQLDELARLLIPRLVAISELTTEVTRDPRKRCPIPKCQRYTSGHVYGLVYFRLPDELRELEVCRTHKTQLLENASRAGLLIRADNGREAIALTNGQATRLWATWRLRR